MNSPAINILIVEDESIVAMDLAAGLEQDGYHICGIADNAEDAIALFKSNEVDILLMDIHIIGSKDGITTAAELQHIKPVPVIFLTAFTDTATIERVKQICPAAFLTKPYQVSNVRIAIELALNNFAVTRQHPAGGKLVSLTGSPHKEKETGGESILQLGDYIFIKSNYRFHKVLLSGVLYAEADNNYVHLVTGNGKFTLRLSLAQLLEKLNYAPMVRIHRSFAVNIHTVETFNEQEVLINGHEIPISRNYKDDFLARFHFR
jgi:two-component system, response regulator PdtaR